MDNASKNRWQVRGAALIIFVLGFAAGLLAMNVYRGFAARDGDRRDRFEQMAEKLQLTDDQKTKVQVIFADTREQLRAVRMESEPKVNEIRSQADSRLQTVLTPEQWQKFQSVRDEMRQRRAGRGGPRRDRP